MNVRAIVLCNGLTHPLQVSPSNPAFPAIDSQLPCEPVSDERYEKLMKWIDIHLLSSMFFLFFFFPPRQRHNEWKVIHIGYRDVSCLGRSNASPLLPVYYRFAIASRTKKKKPHHTRTTSEPEDLDYFNFASRIPSVQKAFLLLGHKRWHCRCWEPR